MGKSFDEYNLSRNELIISLDLNKHPKEYNNLSLIDCKNALKSNEGNYIKQDIGTENIDVINDALFNHFSKAKLNNVNITYAIHKIIPCNNEFVIFAYSNFYITNQSNTNNERYRYMNIFRYNESLNKCSDAIIPYELKEYNGDKTSLYLDGALKYHRGNINGTFTYNSNNELIIAFCESDCLDNASEEIGEPLKLINLGYWNENNNLIIDSNLNPKTFALCPEVELNPIYNINIIDGNSKKGWYNFFIRYKIDKYNYTKWYPIGESIYVDEYQETTIFEHFQGEYKLDDGTEIKDNNVRKITDYIGTDSDICNKTISFNLKLDEIYEKYQIGFTCSTKTYIDCKITNDISSIINSFVLDYKHVNDYDKNQFIIDYQNYYDVKNIINYNNRLYISNYKENTISDNLINTIKNNLDNNLTYEIKTSTLNSGDGFYNIIISEIINEEEGLNSTKTYNKKWIKEGNTLYDIYNEDNKELLLMKLSNTETYIKSNTGKMDKESLLSKLNNSTKNKFKLGVFYNIEDNRPLYTIKTTYLAKDKIAYYKGNIDDYVNGYNDNRFGFKVYIFDLVKHSNNFKLIVNSKDKNVKVENYIASNDYILLKYETIVTTDAYTLIYYGTDTLNVFELFETNISYMSAAIGWKNFTELKTYVEDTYKYEETQKIFNTDINNINYSLIPGQLYNFYIHLVDKYGNASEGIKLSPITKNEKVYIIDILNNKCIRLGSKYNAPYTIVVALKLYDFPFVKNDIIFDINNINKSSVIVQVQQIINYQTTIIRQYVWSEYDETDTNVLNGIQSVLKDMYDKYPQHVKESDVLYTFGETLKDMLHTGTTFAKYFQNTFIDRNKNELFYIPLDENTNNKNISIDFTLNTKLLGKEGLGFNSFFITYEKVNNLLINQGITFDGKNTFDCGFIYDNEKLLGIFAGGEVDGNNDAIGSSLRLCNDNLNFNDTINIGGNKIFYTNIYKTKLDNLTVYINNENTLNYIKAKDIIYKVANSVKDDNLNKETNITFKDVFKGNNKTYPQITVSKMYKNEINIYNDSVKTLIRCTDYIKEDYLNPIKNITTYSHWANGSALLFNANGYRYDSQNHLKLNDNSEYYKDQIPLMNFKFLQITEDFQEFKQFNNSPKSIIIIKNAVDYDDKTAKYYYGLSILCQDTVDLYKNNSLKHDDSIIYTYTNYDETISHKSSYDKTIRRSNYITDESLVNGWRNFNLENYKNITENKGNITKLLGIGELLLVHTEHSLFQFDKNNLLITAERTVQLGQQDTFDIEYKEMFTSEFGFGGLQDKDAIITGEFGYIYYNNDFNKIYQYNGSQINEISSAISWFLNRYKPTDVRFVEDRDNKRILCRFYYKQLGPKVNDYVTYENKNLILSYNYDSKSFISEHEIPFNNWFNTKKFTYILHNQFSISRLYDNGIKLTRKEIITQEYNRYRYKSLEKNNETNNYELFPIFKSANMSFKFIINENYNIPKILNCLTYKLYKKLSLTNGPDNAINNGYEDYVSKDEFGNVSGKIPYSGYKLRVYNDLCDTGELDISTNSKGSNSIYKDITKPYYDLGNFNFNYLRDKNTKSRLYGNYFIVEFIFDADNINNIEFESLNYSITKRII